MTLIVGLRFEGGVLLAGDSCGSDGYNAELRTRPKVFALSKRVAVGYTTSFRMGQILEYELKLPTLPASGDELTWAVTKLVPAIRKAFAAGGWEQKKDERVTGGVFLLAVRERLFCVESDYQVAEVAAGYHACGSGEQYALGALFSNDGYSSARWASATEAEGSARDAMQAAVYHSAFVRPPFAFVETGR